MGRPSLAFLHTSDQLEYTAPEFWISRPTARVRVRDGQVNRISIAVHF